MKIETCEGDVFAEAMPNGMIKLTGEPYSVEYAIVSKEHIDSSAKLWDWNKEGFFYQVYNTLSLLLSEPAGHA